MKNMFKMNKKGFTLVELLAVIVILALLIVVTANTVLPMMNKSKQNAMVVYAERVLNTASASYQADSVTGGSESKYYPIKTLMGEDNYYGCVKVETDTSGSEIKYKYSIAMFNKDDKMGIKKKDLTSVTISGKADTIAKTGNYADTDTKEAYDEESECESYTYTTAS